MENVLQALDHGVSFGLPLVALTDAGTRSAKEVIAHEIRRRDIGMLVGEPTAGAVIPATFQPVSHDAVLMFPSFTLGRYTKQLEGQPVTPDVSVPDDLRTPVDEILEGGIAAAISWLRPAR